MTRTSVLHTSLVSLSLISGVALVGCTDAAESTTGAVESTVVGQPATSAIAPRVTCSIAIGTIPSSALVPGFIGIFAGTQLSCSVGTQVFTVTSQACTDLGCGPINVQTTTPIGTAAQLWGSITQGTAGAACSGSVTVTPPGLSGAVTGTCG
jgi:hypothetical protein